MRHIQKVVSKREGRAAEKEGRAPRKIHTPSVPEALGPESQLGMDPGRRYFRVKDLPILGYPPEE